MADRTQSHDTSTPAMSAETVRSHDVLDEAKINALPLPLIARFAGDEGWLPIHDIGVDAPLCRIDVSGKLEPRRFSEIMELKDGDGVIHDPDDFYLDADTPTEGPAPQTEGMGGEVKAKAKQALYSLRFEGQPMSSMFSAEELGLIVDTVSAALSTPTEGPAPQTEGMGGDATKLRENIEAFLEMHRRGVLTPRTPNIPIELLQKALAALTPPETAEAVPDDLTAAYMAGVERGREEAARLREDLEREIKASVSISETLIETRRLYRVEKLRADDAVKALEEARAATASDPAPATDDRERLVEANHRLMNLLYLADEALMELHGCFPNDEVTEEQRQLKQTCKAIRALTGGDYLNRKGRAAVARAALATEASR